MRILQDSILQILWKNSNKMLFATKLMSRSYCITQKSNDQIDTRIKVQRLYLADFHDD